MTTPSALPLTPPAGRSLLFAALALAVHAVLIGGSLVGTAVIGARCEKSFRDFGLGLDAGTQFALGVARWLNNYWYVLALFLVPCPLADGAILYLLHRRARGWSYVWAAAVVLLVLLTSGCLGGVVYEQYARLIEGLNR